MSYLGTCRGVPGRQDKEGESVSGCSKNLLSFMTYIAKKYSQLQIRSSEESTTGHIVKMLKGKERPPRER